MFFEICFWKEIFENMNILKIEHYFFKDQSTNPLLIFNYLSFYNIILFLFFRNCFKKKW